MTIQKRALSPQSIYHFARYLITRAREENSANRRLSRSSEERRLKRCKMFIAFVGVSLAGCAGVTIDTANLNLVSLGLKQPSPVLDNIVHASALKEYEVSSSSLYISFFKPSSAPLDIRRKENVSFRLANRQYQFSPALAGPAPSFWTNEILIYSKVDSVLRRSLQLPRNMQLAFPLWSPNGELLAFVVREGANLFVGIYSPMEDRLRISRTGNLSLWITGQILEAALTNGGDAKAPFYWTSDSKHIVYGRRVLAPDTSADVRSAALVPTVMDTRRMRDLMGSQNPRSSSEPIELEHSWRQYLFESEVVQVDVHQLTERVLSTPGYYRDILPIGARGDWLVSTLPSKERGVVTYKRLVQHTQHTLEIKNTIFADVSLYPALGARDGVYIWDSSSTSSDESPDCFYYIDLSSNVAQESECLNEDNKVINVWSRQGFLVLDEVSTELRQVRVIDKASGTTVGRLGLSRDLQEKIQLECTDFGWWPVPTSMVDQTVIRNNSLLMSAACGAALARSITDATWLSDIGTGEVIAVMSNEDSALNANALRLNDKEVLILTESVHAEPKFCLRYIAETGCEEIGPRSTALDLDSYRKLYVSANRNDGIKLRGTLLLPKATHRAVNGRFPTIIMQYPKRELSPESFGPGYFGDKRLYSLSHIGDYIEVWLPPALLELGFAVLYFPDWPFLGDYNESAFGPFEKQTVQNGEAYLSALSEIELVDTARLGITGLSAGGNEALLAAAAVPDISFAMAFSPAVNMSINPQGNHFQKKSFWEDNRYYLAMSPALRANEIKQPVLLVHALGDENHLSPASATRSFYFGHSAANGASRTVLLPGGSHVLTNQDLKAHVLYETERWLNSVTAH